MFDVDRILAESFMRAVDWSEELDSTNTRALALAVQELLPIPHLVAARRQTAGRGRGKNRWWLSTGALTFSLVLDAGQIGLTAENWPRVSLTAALAVCETVSELAPQRRVGLRWPNDVHVDGRKICGVLPELPSPVSHQRPVPKRLVLGIGLNVNNSLADAPDEIQSVGVSLRDLAGQEFDLTDVLLDVLGRLQQHLAELAEDDPALGEAWSAYCILRGRTVELLQGERSLRGPCAGIAPDGALLLDLGDGPQRFYSGVLTRVD